MEVGITVGVYYALKNSDNNNVRNTMVTISDSITNEFTKTISIMEYVAMRDASFFRINGPLISQAEYLDMLQLDFFPLNNTIDSNFFIYKLVNSELYPFQNLCAQYIEPNCTITQVVNNKFVPVTNRSIYWPSLFYQSATANTQPFIGYDFGTFPATAYLIDEALLSGNNFTMSFRITLSPSSDGNPYNQAVLISTPVFVNETNSDINNITGFIWLVPRIGNMFDYAISKINISIDRSDIDLFVFDITNDGFASNPLFNISILYKENNPAYKNIWFANNMTSDYSIVNFNYTLFGRNWSIYFKFSQGFIDSSKSTLQIIIASIMGGIFFLIDVIIVILYLLFIVIMKRMETEKKGKTIAVQMLGYVNHEVRNPLNIIKGLAQFTLEKLREFDTHSGGDITKLNDESLTTAISDLSTVCGACDMLEHIVMDILDIRKLESKKLDLDNKNIQLDVFIKDLVKTISQKMNEKRVQFDLVYDKNLIIFIDPYRLKQILLNFLTNAIKYTNEGTITLKIEELRDKIRFSVIDTGIGINDEAKNRIYQPFNQITAQDSTRYGGIGLGLYLCKMLTERMDGNIGFTSEYGKGSVFWSEFPKSNLAKRDDLCIEI